MARRTQRRASTMCAIAALGEQGRSRDHRPIDIRRASYRAPVGVRPRASSPEALAERLVARPPSKVATCRSGRQWYDGRGTTEDGKTKTGRREDGRTGRRKPEDEKTGGREDA